MSPEKKGPKRKIVFSSIAAAQYKRITGKDPPGDVDPRLDLKIPPIVHELTDWERNKFGKVIGQVPSRFSVNPREGDEKGMSVGFTIGDYYVWLIMAKINGFNFTLEQLRGFEYIDIDFGERPLKWVEKAERGIDLIFGETDQEVRINTRIWRLSELQTPQKQSN